MLPTTSGRVPLHTRDQDNQRIREAALRRIAHSEGASADQIEARLRELDQEWDIERLLEMNAASLALTGSLLALTKDRRWALLPVAVTAFLLQHALQGWCPPVPVFRRLGFRTMREIDEERMALKCLRGDFDHASAAGADLVLAAAER
jgi:hypothetical protein